MEIEEPILNRTSYFGPTIALRRERDRQQSFLNKIHRQASSMQSAQPMTSMQREEMLNATKKRIEKNIETLDYFRGIAGLEKGFADLADTVVKTSLELTHECKDVNRESLPEERFAIEVGNAWQHISDLGNTVQAHIHHAKRYHLFYLELDRLDRQIFLQRQQLKQQIADIRSRELESECTINEISTCINETLDQHIRLYVAWQKTEVKSQLVAPLHRRHPLPPGKHSGVLLNAISLPNGQVLKSGAKVLVRANLPASHVHREWMLEDEKSGLETTVPASFVWLKSPDSSPVVFLDSRSNQRSKRSRSSVGSSRQLSNKESVESLVKRLLLEWRKDLLDFEALITDCCLAVLSCAFKDATTVQISKDTIPLKGITNKIETFVALIQGSKPTIPSLATLVEKLKLIRAKDTPPWISTEKGNALVHLINVFEEFFNCFERYEPEPVYASYRNEPHLKANEESSPHTLRRQSISLNRQDPLRQSRHTSRVGGQHLQAHPIPANWLTTSVDCSRRIKSTSIASKTATKINALPRVPLEIPRSERRRHHHKQKLHHRGFSQPPKLSLKDSMTQVTHLYPNGTWVTDDYTLSIRSCPTGRGDSGDVDASNQMVPQSALQTPRWDERSGLADMDSSPTLVSSSHNYKKQKKRRRPKSVSQSPVEANYADELERRSLPVRYLSTLLPLDKNNWIQTGTPFGFQPPSDVIVTPLHVESGTRNYKKHHNNRGQPLPALSVNTFDSGCFTEFESSAPVTSLPQELQLTPTAGKSIVNLVPSKAKKLHSAPQSETFRFTSSCQTGELADRVSEDSCSKKTRKSRKNRRGGHDIVVGRRSKTCSCCRQKDRREIRAYSVACQNLILQDTACVGTDCSWGSSDAAVENNTLVVPKFGKKVQVGKPMCSPEELASGSGASSSTIEFAAQTHNEIHDSANSPHDYVNLVSLGFSTQLPQMYDMFCQTELGPNCSPVIPEIDEVIGCTIEQALSELPPQGTESCTIDNAEKTGDDEEELVINSSDFEESREDWELSKKKHRSPTHRTTLNCWIPEAENMAIHRAAAVFEIGIQAGKPEYAASSQKSKRCQTESRGNVGPQLSSLSCELHFEPDSDSSLSRQLPITITEQNDQGLRFLIDFRETLTRPRSYSIDETEIRRLQFAASEENNH